VERVVDSGVLDLYDGHYGAFAQQGGAGGPELKITVGGLLKHVSKDDGLSSNFSREAGAIQKAADSIADLALKHI
jgi:hypothetical protein